MHCSSGLSHSEAGKLDNFLHFSKPKNLKKKSIVEMGDFNPAIDFLDVLSDDIPKGEHTITSCIEVYEHIFSFISGSLNSNQLPMFQPPCYITTK